MITQTPIALLIWHHFELFARPLFISPVLCNRPLVSVIIDPNPVDNPHDPFLLVCGSVPLEVQPTQRYIELRVTPSSLPSAPPPAAEPDRFVVFEALNLTMTTFESAKLQRRAFARRYVLIAAVFYFE